MPKAKTAAPKKTPTKKVTPKLIKKASLKDDKKGSAASTPKVLSRKVSVELKKSESLKT